MQALPYLQLRESESRASSEKTSYRLSLHDASAKTAQHKDGQTTSGKNVNRSDFSRENTSQFEGTSSIYFGDIPQFRTPLPTPSPSRILKPSPRSHNHSSDPVWVEPLGVWLTNRRKCNNYETFTRNVELLRRTSDMFLDPCPHVPRCSHERTLSALRRQKQRFKTEEEMKKQERHIRIIERVQQIRDVWEQWTDKAKSAVVEHENRLTNFRKSRDGYSDPEEVIRKKREERIERERLFRLESEKRREEVLRKKRFRLPKIIVTYYEDKVEKRPESQCSNVDNSNKLPSLVNIPNADNDEDNEESDAESLGSKGDRLEVPKPQIYFPEGYFEDTMLTQEGEESEPVLHDNEVELEVVTEPDSQENDGDVDKQTEVVEDKCENVLKEESGDETGNVLEDELLEDKHENVLEDVAPVNEPVETEKDQVLKNENTGTNIDEQEMLYSKQDEVLEKPLDEQDSADNNNGAENLEPKESERDVEEKANENEEETKEMQMNFLVPPRLRGLASENGSDNGSIIDADDTASMMAAFVPVALGIGNGIIPNDAMRASSVLDRYHVPSQARLNNAKQGKNGGAWKPKLNDKKQYLEVDLGTITKVTQVSTQGHPTPTGAKVHKKDKCWVESYSLAFSTDGSQWQQYAENGAVKVFRGNRDNNSVIINSISNPVEARVVRFIPKSWKNSIAMRVEVYGEVIEPELTSVTPPLAASPTETEEPPLHEPILEEEEEAEEFVCGVEEELDEQDAWEEDTVHSVVETVSQFESKVAVVSRSPSSMINLTVQGEMQTPKGKRKSKKPKQEKPEENDEKKTKKKKKKKTKTVKEKKQKAPLVTNLPLLEEVEEEEGASSPEEQEEEEEEEETKINSPSLPEIPKRPESVTRIPSPPKRTFSMFPVRKESPEEPSKPRRRRAQTDDSIRSELLRQQVAEDRRRKLAAAMGKPKREVQVQGPAYDRRGVHSDLDDFLTKYCIVSEGQANYYHRIFKTFDEDNDGFLFPEDVLEALESVNSNLLSDSHISYIYRVRNHAALRDFPNP